MSFGDEEGMPTWMFATIFGVAAFMVSIMFIPIFVIQYFILPISGIIILYFFYKACKSSIEESKRKIEKDYEEAKKEYFNCRLKKGK